MSAYREATFGTTVCRIYVNKHVELFAKDHSSVAKAALVDGEEITDENGDPVERDGSTDDQAVDSMCRYLEGRFGSRAG